VSTRRRWIRHWFDAVRFAMTPELPIASVGLALQSAAMMEGFSSVSQRAARRMGEVRQRVWLRLVAP
jgi:hypothetical protein